MHTPVQVAVGYDTSATHSIVLENLAAASNCGDVDKVCAANTQYNAVHPGTWPLKKLSIPRVKNEGGNVHQAPQLGCTRAIQLKHHPTTQSLILFLVIDWRGLSLAGHGEQKGALQVCNGFVHAPAQT